MARAGALPRVGRKRGRLLPVAATVRRYGARRLRAELRAEGHTISGYALCSLLHRQGLRALSTRPQRPRTTVADPAAITAENRLLGQPAPIAPDQMWVGRTR